MGQGGGQGASGPGAQGPGAGRCPPLPGRNTWTQHKYNLLLFLPVYSRPVSRSGPTPFTGVRATARRPLTLVPSDLTYSDLLCSQQQPPLGVWGHPRRPVAQPRLLAARPHEGAGGTQS